MDDLGMFDKDLFARILAELMAGRSANQLAKETGINQTTISRFLSAAIDQPKIEQLMILATHFGVTLDQLVGWKPLNRKLQELDGVFVAMNERKQSTFLSIGHTILQEPDAPYR